MSILISKIYKNTYFSSFSVSQYKEKVMRDLDAVYNLFQQVIFGISKYIKKYHFQGMVLLIFQESHLMN